MVASKIDCHLAYAVNIIIHREVLCDLGYMHNPVKNSYILAHYFIKQLELI